MDSDKFLLSSSADRAPRKVSAVSMKCKFLIFLAVIGLISVATMPRNSSNVADFNQSASKNVTEFLQTLNSVAKPSAEVAVALKFFKKSTEALIKKGLPMGDLIANVAKVVAQPESDELLAIKDLHTEVKKTMREIHDEVQYSAKLTGINIETSRYKGIVEAPLIYLNVSLSILLDTNRTVAQKEADIKFYTQACEKANPNIILSEIHSFLTNCENAPLSILELNRRRRFEIFGNLTELAALRRAAKQNCLDIGPLQPDNLRNYQWTSDELMAIHPDELPQIYREVRLHLQRTDAFYDTESILNLVNKKAKMFEKTVEGNQCIFDLSAEESNYERAVIYQLQNRISLDTLTASVHAMMCGNLTNSTAAVETYLALMVPGILDIIMDYVPKLMERAWPTAMLKKIKLMTDTQLSPDSYPLERRCLQHLADVTMAALNTMGSNESAYQVAVGRHRKSSADYYTYSKCTTGFCAEIQIRNLMFFVARYERSQECKALGGREWHQIHNRNISSAFWTHRSAPTLAALIQAVETDLNLTLSGNVDGYRTLWITRDHSQRPNGCWAFGGVAGGLAGNLTSYTESFYHFPSACESFRVGYFIAQ